MFQHLYKPCKTENCLFYFSYITFNSCAIGTSGSNSVAYFVLRIYEGGYNKKEKYDPPTSRCGADEVYENPTDTL